MNSIDSMDSMEKDTSPGAPEAGAHTLSVYIPHVFPNGRWKEFGGIAGMKNYIRKTFASLGSSGVDESGEIDDSLQIGFVKQVELVPAKGKKAGCMYVHNDYAAFIRFIPSNTDVARSLCQSVLADERYKLVHNVKKGYYWTVLLGDKHREKADRKRGGKIGKGKVGNENVKRTHESSHSPQSISSPTSKDTENRVSGQDICDAFESLTVESRPLKRRRLC
jgi:hypothetical protein